MSINENKRKKAEQLFKEYLNKKSIPFYCIDQNRETYSKEFYRKNIQRPDFIIYTEKQIYHIDVKYRTKKTYGESIEKRYYINHVDLIRLFNFQSKFNAIVWISFINNLESPKFYYASISDIYDFYKKIEVSIGENIRKMVREYCTDNQKDYYSEMFIFVPDNLLYKQLSYEKGIFNYINNENFEEEIKCHESEWVRAIYSKVSKF